MSMEDEPKNIEFENVIPKRYRNVLADKLKAKYQVVKGPKSIFYQSLKSTNQVAPNSSFLLNPARTQFISDLMYEEVSWDVVLTLTNSTGAPLRPFPAGSLSVSMFPNIAVTNTLTTIIGNSNLTINAGQIMNAVMAYNKGPQYTGCDFVDSSQLDAYVDIAESAGSTFKTNSLKSPQANYASATYGNESRFNVQWINFDNSAGNQTVGYDNLAIGNGVTKQVHIQFKATNPIWNGLNSLTDEDEGTYCGITNFQLNKTVVANLASRLINYRPPAGMNVTGITATPLSAPVLYYRIINMPDDIPVPKYSQYLACDYAGLQMQPVGAVNPSISGAGATPVATPFTSQPINLTNIPRCIYFWFGQDLNTLGVAGNVLENSCAPGTQITQVTIQYGGFNIVQNLVSPFQVYKELCGSEGYSKTFIETGYVVDNSVAGDIPVQVGCFGTVCRLDCSKLALDYNQLANGVSTTLPFQIQAQFLNLSSRQRNISLFIQPVYDRLYTVENGNVDSTYSLLTPDQVEYVRKHGAFLLENKSKLIGGRRGHIHGEGFWDNFWTGFKMPFQWAGKAYDAVKPVASLVGLGKKKHHRHRGRGLADSDSESDDESQHGGAVLSKSEMRKKLKFI